MRSTTTLPLYSSSIKLANQFRNTENWPPDLLRSVFAILSVHIEEQGHSFEVPAFEWSERCTLDLVWVIEAASRPAGARAGSTSY
jgi:hypothetical protein